MALISRYPNLREVVWVQEEPRNMGYWTYVAPRIATATRKTSGEGRVLHFRGKV